MSQVESHSFKNLRDAFRVTRFGEVNWLIALKGGEGGVGGDRRGMLRVIGKEAARMFQKYGNAEWTVGDQSLLIRVECVEAAIVEAKLSDMLKSLIEERLGTVIGGAPGRVHEIGVRYNGPDLADLAQERACDVEDIIAAHLDTELNVLFCGFAPGFAYLGEVNELLRLPRKNSPRLRVNAGAVAVAAGYSAIYPFTTAGGWHWIGNTDFQTTLKDSNDNPSGYVFEPGDRVRFKRIE